MEVMQSNLPQFFKALSDPTRLRILRLLMEAPHCVCEMEEALSLPQPLLSRHLSYLRAAGLVEGVRDGVRVNYRLRPDHEALRIFLPALRRALETGPQPPASRLLRRSPLSTPARRNA